MTGNMFMRWKLVLAITFSGLTWIGPLAFGQNAEPTPAEAPPMRADAASERGEAAQANAPSHLSQMTDEGSLAEPNEPDLHPILFNRVEPGRTTLAELKELWGAPVRQLQTGDADTWIYKVAFFKQIDIHHDGNKVTGILIHLLDSLPVAQVQKDLQLQGIRGVLLPNESGEVLGQAYPERGALLHYATDTDAELVSEILLEPIAGETFRLRAEYDFTRQYQNHARDLEQALQLDPDDAEARYLLAALDYRTGQSEQGWNHIRVARNKRPTETRYQLLEAQLMAEKGQLADALRHTRAATEQPNVSPLDEARAHLQLGNLLHYGPTPNISEAMQSHLKCIQLSVASAGDVRFQERRTSKEMLISAHLSVARDVALGNFQRQSEVVPKWLNRAKRLAEELITHDNGDPALRIDVARDTLAAYAELTEAYDPTDAVEQAVQLGRTLIANNTDSLYQKSVEWDLCQTLFHAVRIERTRGEADSALRYAASAMALLENMRTVRQETHYARLLEGQLYFLVGSIHAVQKNSHAEAVAWYDKARPLLQQEIVPSLLTDTGQSGERFVSMGVSYWEVSQRPLAMELTEYGLQLVQQAVNEGTLEQKSLAVPYGNLATMHQSLGDRASALHYTELMTRADPGTVQR